MGSKSDSYEADILKASTGQATTILSTTPLTNVYCALFTANPTDSTGGTEATGGSYARVQTVGKWAAPSGTTSVVTNAAVTFPTASADWGTITGFALMTASTAGTVMYWGALSVSKAVLNGDTASFASGAITLTED
jgi:hypothetical protein